MVSILSRTVLFHLKNDASASIGIVFEESVPEASVERFERALSCYCDFRKYSKDDRPQKPLRPPPPYQLKEGNQEDVPKGSYFAFRFISYFESPSLPRIMEFPMEPRGSFVHYNLLIRSLVARNFHEKLYRLTS